MPRRVLDGDILSFEGRNKTIAENVFGSEFLKDSVVLARKNPSSANNIIELVDQWIQVKLDYSSSPYQASEPHTDTRPGRLGPSKVVFDKESRSNGGAFSVSDDLLRLNSRGNFSSIRANVCFFSGKWHYEIQLETKGVMQLGWAIGGINKFSPEIGIGDTIDSYGYDGQRVRKWNVSTSEYGEPWLNGDIIGCAIDLDIGSIYFYRNGRALGEAYPDIQLGPGCAYFPAVSLAQNEGIVANFGGTPFKYPVDGFAPPQLPPTNKIIRASLIFSWFHRLLDFSEDKRYNLGKVERKQLDILEEASVLVFARLLMSQLSPLLESVYIIEACLIPFLNTLANVTFVVEKKGLPMTDFKMKVFCEILTIFLQEEELNFVLKAVTKDLLSKFRQVSSNVEFINQKRSITVLLSMSHNYKIRDWLLNKVYFSFSRLPEFMDTKPIDEPALTRTIPTIWWESMEDSRGTEKSVEQKRRSYRISCKKIHLGVAELELLQVDFLQKLMDNKDEIGVVKPSSRKIFLNRFRYFLKDNMIGLIPMPAITPLPISYSYFHRLLSVLRRLWERELPHETPHVPTSKFYDTSIQYYNIDRFGGAWTHLIKRYRQSLLKRLGAEHNLLQTTDQAVQTEIPTVASTTTGGASVESTGPTPAEATTTSGSLIGIRMLGMFNLRQFNIELRSTDYKAATPGVITSSDSLMELMDGVIMFYHVGAHKQLQNISGVKENMDRYITSLNETQAKLNDAMVNRPSSVNSLKNSIQIFQKKIEELSRYMAWIKAAVFTSTKQADLVWLLRAILTTLRKASREGEYFAFVPVFYIESLVEISTALRTYFDPTVPLTDQDGHTDLMIQVADFLAVHFSDTRVVNPSAKDTLIQALAGFVTTSSSLRCLESIPVASQVKVVEDLLQPYDQRPWGQSNWILLRMWQGCGYAFRYQKSPHYTNMLGPKLLQDHTLLIQQTFNPCPSVLFQNLIGKVLLNNEQISSGFINSLLNQLNWSFSEVIGMLQEIQNLSSRPERVFIEAHQLKVCATCFDFALGLLRVLEMVICVSRPVLIDPKRLNSESLLERLCQLLCQILLRVSSVTGCFYHVVSLDIPDLETINPFPILTAVVGILVALMKGDKSLEAETKKDLTPVVRCLLSEPAFELKTLKYVLGEDTETNKSLKGKRKFSFFQYPEAVSETELKQVRDVINILAKCAPKLISGTKETPDEELCLICCAVPMSVIFIPCLHKSCKSCISHFLLMNTKKSCFFCKADINSVTDFSGVVLYNIKNTGGVITDLPDETNLI